MRMLLIFLSTFYVTEVSSQSVLNFDTYEANDNDIKVMFDTLSLNNSKIYSLEVVGTYSAWNPSYWSAICGEVTAAPMYPSISGPMTGNVGFDFEYGFSYPTSSLCSGAIFPFSSVRFEISLDNGDTWFHPFTSEVYSSSHIYNFQIEGLGFPLGVRQNSPYNSDDYGILQFTISQESSFGVDSDVNESELVNLYPNPATNEIRIQHSFNGDVVYKIYNTVGALLVSDKYDGSISLDNLQQGTYFIELFDQLKAYKSRFIKL
jgi:hypothetical protein